MNRDMQTAIALFVVVSSAVALGYLFARTEQRERFTECVDHATSAQHLSACRALQPEPLFPLQKGRS